VICENPERAATGKKIEEIRSEIAQLEEVEEGLDQKLEMRRKQFHLLVHTIQELQELLNGEDSAGVGDSAGSDATPTRSNEDSMDIS
jgi:THO complex subunit 7